MKNTKAQVKAIGMYLAEMLATAILVAGFFYASLAVYRMAIAPLDFHLY